MSLDLKLIEAQLTLELLAPEDMPQVGWDALEAGFDGPAIRRLAALEQPTYFEIADVLPRARQELGLSDISVEQAAARISKRIAEKILASGDDPMAHLRDFEQLWFRTNYSHSMAALGTLYYDVSIAQIDGTSDSEIRNWVTAILSNFVRSQNDYA